MVTDLRKHDEQAPHECLLVVDATTGSNALVQAREFKQAVGLPAWWSRNLMVPAKAALRWQFRKNSKFRPDSSGQAKSQVIFGISTETNSSPIYSDRSPFLACCSVSAG